MGISKFGRVSIFFGVIILLVIILFLMTNNKLVVEEKELTQECLMSLECEKSCSDYYKNSYENHSLECRYKCMTLKNCDLMEKK